MRFYDSTNVAHKSYASAVWSNTLRRLSRKKEKEPDPIIPIPTKQSEGNFRIIHDDDPYVTGVPESQDDSDIIISESPPEG